MGLKLSGVLVELDRVDFKERLNRQSCLNE